MNGSTAITPFQIPQQVASTSTTAVPSHSNRRLQLLEMETHRTDRHTRCDGTVDKESVVSSLRWFHLRVGVSHAADGNGGPIDVMASMPLRAVLLYENGHEVEDQSQLQGDKEVITCNGTAQFKLKIKSLSSHREKQRFRIRIREALNADSTASVVTGPIKTITKLRVTKASSMGSPTPMGAMKRKAAPMSDAMLRAEGGSEWDPHAVKRERGMIEKYEQTMKEQADLIAQLNETHAHILTQLQELKQHLEPSC